MKDVLLIDAAKEVMKAWEMDLEWGSHHLTNQASEKFANEYPRMVKALVRLKNVLYINGEIE